MTTVPSVLSILLCEIIIIHNDNKKTLVGLFDQAQAPSAPAVQKIGFYARMTDMEGEYRFQIRIVFLGETGEEPIAGAETAPIAVTDRLSVVEIPINLPPTPLPKFGRYEVQLFSADMYLGRATFAFVKI